MNTDVTYVREEVLVALKDWTRVRDCVAGERHVKAAKQLYLPKPEPTGNDSYDTARYIAYIERASFLGVTGRTVNGLIGIAFGNPPKVDIPESMNYVVDDVDGAGGGILNQAHATLSNVLETGRYGLLTDYPARNQPASVAEKQALNIHPVIKTYVPESIVNWKVNSDNDLIMVVLYEEIEQQEGYEVSIVRQWRELAIGWKIMEGEQEDPETTSPHYVVRLWREPESVSGQKRLRTTHLGWADLGVSQKAATPVLEEEFIPTKADGSEWHVIPFQFVGAMDNNPTIDKAPLLDIANKNITHYQVSADYYESVHFTGQPTYAFIGVTQTWVDEVLKGEVLVGSRAGIPLPENSDAKILETSPNTLAGEALIKLEKEMASLGAYLMTPGTVAKTAEQSRSDTFAAHSVLSLATENVNNAYKRSLSWVAEYEGTSEEVEFRVSTKFVGLMVDPQVVTSVVASWQAQAIPDSDKNNVMRLLGLIDPAKTDDEIEGEIEGQTRGLGV